MSVVETPTVNRPETLDSLARITLIVALSGVTMTFGALIAVFLLRAQRDEAWSHIQLPPILWLSTLILAASSFSLQKARRYLAADNVEQSYRLFLWTFVLGALFLVGQIVAGVQILASGVVLENNPHSWFIFLFGGLHGLHIVAGLVGLGFLVSRTRERASGPRYQMATRAGALGVGIFWHYMDAMWLLLFGLLVFWRR